MSFYFVFWFLLHSLIHSPADFITYSFIIYSCTHSLTRLLTPQILLCIFIAWLWKGHRLGVMLSWFQIPTHLLTSVSELGQETFHLWPTSSLSNMRSIKPATQGGVFSVWHGSPKAFSKWQLIDLLLSAKHCGQRGVRPIVHWEG